MVHKHQAAVQLDQAQTGVAAIAGIGGDGALEETRPPLLFRQVKRGDAVIVPHARTGERGDAIKKWANPWATALCRATVMSTGAGGLCAGLQRRSPLPSMVRISHDWPGL